MKNLQILLIVLFLGGCYGIVGKKKFDLKINIDQNFKHGYHVSNVTQEFVNGQLISSDSTSTNTNINV